MKPKLTRKEAQEKIEDFFKQEELAADYVRKIKRLVMKYNIKLGKHRKRFCKKCFADLRNGSVRINKSYKNTECIKCGFINKRKIKD